MIKYIEYGNIFNIDGVTSYAHGCNCAGAMGKGIAIQFKEKFPEMYKEYKSLCSNGKFTLGDLFEYNYGEGYVFNLGTQITWRTKAELRAIEESFTRMLSFATKENIKKIALPKIGAGLGGLKWQDVKRVIESKAIEYPNIDLYVVENFS
jgi:O-acetyl-ADP-ribose deacetylase (regulator of RNase III)